MVLKRLFVFIAVFLSTHAYSQNNIAGIWEGKFYSTTGLGPAKLVVEIYQVNDSLFKGLTHLYYEGRQYEHYKMFGLYNKRDSMLFFREEITIAVKLGEGWINCLGTYKMLLSRNGTDLVQKGIWDPNRENCAHREEVWLQKKMDIVNETAPIVKTKPPEKTPVIKNPVVKKEQVIVSKEKRTPAEVTVPVQPPKETPVIKKQPMILPAKLMQRETDVQSLLEIEPSEKDSIRVDVYDNGEIDGDTVSVYEDGTARIARRMITAKAITFYITLNKNVNPISHLRLVAESLGSIPPCTALMVVTTKKHRYEVRLSSSFSKNATVELFLKE